MQPPSVDGPEAAIHAMPVGQGTPVVIASWNVTTVGDKRFGLNGYNHGKLPIIELIAHRQGIDILLLQETKRMKNEIVRGQYYVTR